MVTDQSSCASGPTDWPVPGNGNMQLWRGKARAAAEAEQAAEDPEGDIIERVLEGV